MIPQGSSINFNTPGKKIIIIMRSPKQVILMFGNLVAKEQVPKRFTIFCLVYEKSLSRLKIC